MPHWAGAHSLFAIINGRWENIHLRTSWPALSFGRWHHIACVLDPTGSNVTLRVYVDGKVFYEAPLNSTLGSPEAPTEFRAAQGGDRGVFVIGGLARAPSPFLLPPLSVDDVGNVYGGSKVAGAAAWRGVLSGNAIKTHYEAGFDCGNAPVGDLDTIRPAFFYRMLECSGRFLRDSGPDGKHAVIEGQPSSAVPWQRMADRFCGLHMGGGTWWCITTNGQTTTPAFFSRATTVASSFFSECLRLVYPLWLFQSLWLL